MTSLLLKNFKFELKRMLDMQGRSALPEVFERIAESNLQYDQHAFANLRSIAIENMSNEFISKVKIFIDTLGLKESVSIHYNIPIRPRFFIGRETFLQEIHNTLTNKSIRVDVLLLKGIGGMGKTTLVQEYLYSDHCLNSFDKIIYASVNKNLKYSFILTVSLALGLEEKRKNLDMEKHLDLEKQLEMVKSEMKKIKGNNLLVIDNVIQQDYKELEEMYLSFNETGWKILITTRAAPDMYAFLDVSELEIEDAMLLFAFYYTKENMTIVPDNERKYRLEKYIAEQGIEANLKKLLEIICCHTLLTELLAKTGNNRGLSVKSIISAYLEKKTNHKNLKAKIWREPPHYEGKSLSKATLHEYMLNLFETAYLVEITGDKEADDENEAIATMLRFFSVLPPHDIPVADLLILWRIEENSENAFVGRLHEIMQTGWIQEKQQILQGEDDSRNLAYRMHQLVQDVVYEKLGPDSDNCAPLVETITDILRKVIIYPERFQQYAKAAADKIDLLDEKNSRPG
ncbi:MAG: NB-ARC domain-containing protein [Bacteroidetes bacterium]|nr:NB-ARC domain-containing protein [Bacteroidota bacterium]